MSLCKWINRTIAPCVGVQYCAQVNEAIINTGMEQQQSV